MSITFFAPGTPVTQGSKRIGRMGERPIILDVKDRELKAWREVVATCARFAYKGEPYAGAVSVTLAFALRRPKRLAHALAPPPHVTKPDLDKLARAIFDALTGTVLRDDSVIARCVMSKRYAGPGRDEGVTVTVAFGDAEGLPD